MKTNSISLYYSYMLIFIISTLFIFLSTFQQYASSQDTDSLNSNKTIDKFGILQINPTIDGRREWYAKWDNGVNRTIEAVDHDHYDLEFHIQGDGYITIDGNGTATMSGEAPRMYIYDEIGKNKWNNVEITFYAQRINETKNLNWSGIIAGGPTEHQDASLDPCLGQGYYARMLFNGYVDFEKETKHQSDEGYISANRTKIWSSELPKNIWIGFKFIQRVIDDRFVKLELYMDLSDGYKGGSWDKLIEYTDKGGWGNPNVMCPNQTYDAIFNQPATSVLVRADEVSEIKYKNFSVREISPL